MGLRKRWTEDGESAMRAEIERVFPGITRVYASGQFLNWPSDPWTRGSYSFPAVGELTRTGALLRRGLGRISFAGEHVCPKFVGYMEGALQSGIHAARQIARGKFSTVGA